MKLHYFLTVLSGISAKKNESKPKNAWLDMSEVRTNWKDAVCIVEPDNCKETILIRGETEGSIELTEEEYRPRIAKKWVIEVPANLEIKLQWETMDLEWHKHCAYDRVHIIDAKRGSRLGR